MAWATESDVQLREARGNDWSEHVSDEPRVLINWVHVDGLDRIPARLLGNGSIEQCLYGTWGEFTQIPKFAAVYLELEQRTKELEEANAEIEQLNKQQKELRDSLWVYQANDPTLIEQQAQEAK